MKKIRIISLIISVTLIFCIVPVNAFSAETSVSTNVSSSLTAALDKNSVPEMIPYEVALASGHVSREYAQEDALNSVVFKNSDETNTMYLFDEDVKYIDSDGVVKDKSNVLYRNFDGSYENVNNDIRVNYPANISSGVVLSYNGITMTMVPENAATSVGSSIDADNTVELLTNYADSVCYDEVFGEKTSLKYTQTYSGFKEDIIFEENPQSNVYSFIVMTKGIELRNESGIINAYYNDTLFGKFGQIIIYDSYYNFALGDVTLDTISVGKCYRINIIAPREYLDSEGIVYPVTVDPSFTVTTSSSNKTIEDATIFSNYKENFGEWISLFVGNYNAWYPTSSQQRGTARTLMKFPGLFSNTTFQNYFKIGKISSVKLNFADMDCGSGPNTLKAYRVTNNWDESSIFYDSGDTESINGSIWTAYTTSTSGGSVTINPQTATVPYPRYQIDITSIVSYYMNNSNVTNCGLLLKSTDETAKAVVLGASESGDVGGRADSKPYLTINYISMPTTETLGIIDGGIYQFVNYTTGKAMSYSSTLTQQTADATSDSQQFKVKYISSGAYEIIPVKDEDYSKRISAMTSTLSVATANNTSQQRWYLVRIGNGIYRIYSKYSSNYLLVASTSSSSIKSSSTTTGSLWNFKFIRYDVPLYAQLKRNTCGPACGTMALHYYGCTDVTETEFEAYSGDYDHTVAYIVKTTLNHFLSNGGLTFTYQYEYVSSFSTESEYISTIRTNLSNNHLVFVQAKIPEGNPYFAYDTDGHWLLICGVYYDSASGEYIAAINDPHYEHRAYVHVPLSVIYSYNQAHGGCILTVD